MAVQGVVEGSAPTKHSVRVEWFRHEPGGGTIFVKPADADGTAQRPVAGRAVKTDASE